MPQIDVLYYDDEEEELFKNGPHSTSISRVVESGIDTQLADLLAASMFMEQKNALGWKTRDDLRKRVADRVREFNDYFGLDVEGAHETVGAKFEPKETPNSQIERIGVGLSLVTMDSIFKTHGADWEKLDRTNQKDLDFRVASLGESFLVVEAKGTLVQDVTKKDGISGKKTQIKEKKDTRRDLGSNDYLVGTIAAVPPIRSDQTCRVWLVDPPLERPRESPQRFKLLARMRAYQSVLALIGDPHLLLALTNRLRALETIGRIEELDGIALTSSSGKLLGVPPSAGTIWSGSPGRHTGVVSRIEDGLVYVGVVLEVLELLAGQDQKRITSWRHRTRPPRLERIKVRKRDIESGGTLPVEVDRYDRFDWDFAVSESVSGLVVGLARAPRAIELK